MMPNRSLLAVGVACVLARSPVLAQELRYEVRLHQTSNRQTLAIEVSGSGFPETGTPLEAQLPNWGSWTELGAPYLTNVTVNERPVTPDSAGTISLGNGSFVLRYELPVLADTSDEAKRHSLLPRGAPGTALAAVRNTLVVVRRGGTQVDARASIRLAAAPTGGTFTGWAGFAAGSQSARVLPIAETENGFYAFGVSEPTTRTADGVRIEVASFPDGAKRVGDVAEIASRTLPVLRRVTGVRPDSVVRLIVQGSGLSGVTRGTTTQFGIVISLSPDDDWNETTRELIVHELTHLWIGRRFPDEHLIWFSEGFTDYLALWTAAATGIVDPDWFAQRLAAVADEVAALPPAAPRPLAAPEAVGRDNDGPAERLAYRGGALAALSLDVALRTAGKGSVGAFIGRVLSTSQFILTEREIRAAAGALGINAELRAAIDAAPIESPWEALRAVGFLIAEEPASLVALGIAAEAIGRSPHLTMGPAVVRAIDSNGPSKESGISPGDTVTIRSARRQNPPTHDTAITSASLGAYTFGSSVVPSGAEKVTLEVRHGGATRTVEVTPRLVAGGVRLSGKWQAHASQFFTIVAADASTR